MRVIVGVATTGRASIAAATIRTLSGQVRKPDRVVITVADPGDIDPDAVGGLPFPVDILVAERGLTRQRNRVLDELDSDDIVLFIDDDFLVATDYLLRLERLFVAEPTIVVATGHVAADGILGPGLTHMEGLSLLAGHACSRPSLLTNVHNAYGCNMAIRAAPVVAHGLRFDERLPLYGWLEDVDFSRALASHGRIVREAALVGVHLGTKTGRGSGLRLGYSQVANPVYLRSKKTMQRGRAYAILLRNLAANLAKSARPEPWVDRRGRLRGNVLALADLLRGRLDPERVLTFP